MTSAIFVLCHGDWGIQMVHDTSEHFGLTSCIKVYPLGRNQIKTHYLQQIEADLNEYEQVIFLCDLYGSSTFTTALSLGLKNGSLVYTDLSVEMLIKLNDCLNLKIGNSEIIELMSQSQCFKGEELTEKYKTKFGGN